MSCRTLYDDFCVWLRAGDRELEYADLDNQLSEYLREKLGSPIEQCKNLDCLGYIGDYTPNYMEIIISRYKDPYWTNQYN